MSTPICSSRSSSLKSARARLRAKEGDTAARDDALLDRRAGRVERVLDAVPSSPSAHLGGGADLDQRHTAGELREPLLELLTVVVRVGVLDLGRIWLIRPSMSSLSPAPSTIVVLSLSMTTRLAVPSRSRVTFSSLKPTSFEMTWPPVRTAMSCSIALRRSPKPGALTAARVERAAELVDDERGERLALDVLGDDQERLAGLRDLLERRQQVLHREIFLSWIRM
jgi:hypothetical protein